MSRGADRDRRTGDAADADAASLDAERARLRDVDDRLVALIAERLEVARSIGRLKKEAGVAIRDFQQEAEVLEQAHDRAAEAGVRADLVEDIFDALIKESLHAQEEVHVHAQYTAGERTAAVVGGAGRMGRWFATFLSAQGYRVLVEDPAGPPEGFEALGGLDRALDLDLVVVSVPVRATRDVLEALAGADGLVFDIASIKAPFVDVLRERAGAGDAVTSVHPLWGPGTRTLAGRNLMVMDCGDPDAAEAAVEVFRGTLARPLRVPLEAHDEAMAYTLGLAHAVNIWFASLLRESGRDFDEFAARGSSTFLRQARLARSVVAEEPGLYHDIQALNPHMPGVYDAMRKGLEAFVDAVGDREDFLERMRAAHAFMEVHDWASRS